MRKKNEQTAKDNEAKAEQQRLLAEKNALEAERQAKNAMDQEARAREQEGIAVENADRAIRNEREAQQQRRIAQRQERIAAVRAEEAAAAAFRSKIGLAASQIEANMFNRAKSELSEIADRSGEEAWFQPPPWEFARLRYLLDLSDLTIDTGLAVNCLAVSSDGQTVAVAGEDNRVLLYPLGQTTPREIPVPLDQVTKLAFSGSGKRLAIACTRQAGAAGDRGSFASEVVVWDLESDQAVATHRPPDGHWVLDLHLHGPDDSLEIIAGLANMAAVPGELTKDVLQIWQPSNRVLVGHNTAVRAVALSSDGNTLISADDFGVAQIWRRSNDQGFQLLRERDQRVFMPNDGQTIHDVRFSPDDRLVATAGADGSIKLWNRADLIDAERNEDIQPARPVLAGHTAAVLDVGFSADGRLLVSASEDGTVRVWQVSDGRQIALLRGHSDAVRSCAFSPLDPDRIVSGSADRDLRVWSLAGYREFLAIRSEAMPEMLDARFSPDGRQAITAHRRGVFFGAAAVWPLTFDGDRPNLERTTPRLLQEGHTLYVTRANVHRRGDKTELLTVAADGVGCLWDADRGRELLRVSGILRRLNYGFPLAAMSADGRWIVAVSSGRGTASEPENDFAGLWDRQQLVAAEAPPMARMTDAVEGATAVAVSASGRWLFSGHQLGKGILWKHPDGGGTVEPGWTIDSIGRPISAAWFSPDESRLFCVSEYVIRQFDVATGRELVQGRLSHAENVISAAMNGDGTRLIAASGDGSLTLWDLSRPDAAGAKPQASLVTPKRNIQAVDITGDGAFVLDVGTVEAGDGTEKTVRLFHVQSDGSLQEKSQIRFLGQEPESAVFYRDDASQIVVVGGYEAVLWDIGQPVPQRIRTFSAEGIPTAVRVSSDGRQVVTAHQDGAVKVWDAASGRAVARLQTPPDATVPFACFSPDDGSVFTAGSDGQVSVWQAESGEFVRQFCRHESGQAIYQIAISPDGKKLATASADGTASVWDLQTGERLAELTGHQGEVLAVAFHPKEQWLATAGADQTARVWDLATKEPLAVLRGHSKRVSTLGFSPDGRRLATGSADATAKIWAIRLAAVIPAGDATTTSDAPDSADGPQTPNDAEPEDVTPFATEVRIDEILTIREHRDEIVSVEFSADGKNLLTSGRDGQAIVWPAASRPAANEADDQSPPGPVVP
jgi:WD40 repeat protein